LPPWQGGRGGGGREETTRAGNSKQAFSPAWVSVLDEGEERVLRGRGKGRGIGSERPHKEMDKGEFLSSSALREEHGPGGGEKQGVLGGGRGVKERVTCDDKFSQQRPGQAREIEGGWCQDKGKLEPEKGHPEYKKGIREKGSA